MYTALYIYVPRAVQGLRPGRRIVGLGVTDWGDVE
jgi:hypothetical protein